MQAREFRGLGLFGETVVIMIDCTHWGHVILLPGEKELFCVHRF